MLLLFMVVGFMVITQFELIFGCHGNLKLVSNHLHKHKPNFAGVLVFDVILIGLPNSRECSYYVSLKKLPPHKFAYFQIKLYIFS